MLLFVMNQLFMSLIHGLIIVPLRKWSPWDFMIFSIGLMRQEWILNRLWNPFLPLMAPNDLNIPHHGR